MSNYIGRVTSRVPVDEFAKVAVTALRKAGFESPFVNNELKTITGRLIKCETVLGNPWRYEFSLWLSWKGDASGSDAQVDVCENTYEWSSEDCRKVFEEFRVALASPEIESPATQDKPQSGARWASEEDLRRAGYVSHLGLFEHGFLISPFGKQFLNLSEADSNKHVLVCGPTGSGKTSGIFIPNLLERISMSAIVTEATGSKGRADLYEKTAGFRSKAGQKIFYFNPDDLSSDRVNPLDLIETYADARRITEVIMQSTTLASHRGDQAWEMSERLLLTSLILHAVGERTSGNCTLAFVRDLLYRGADGIAQIIKQSRVAEAMHSFQGFYNNSTEAYRSLVAQGLATRLSIWADPKVRELTRTTEIDFDDLKEKLFTWYLATPADKPELKPLAALMLNTALEIAGRTDFRYQVGLFLDEFTNFGYVRGFPEKLTILRHDGIPVVLGIQDYVQLELTYEREAPLFLSQPATRIFFRPNDLKTAQNISRGLGTAEEFKVNVTSSGHLNEDSQKKPLLSAEDLLALDTEDIVVFLPKTYPARMKAFSWADYCELTDEERYPAPERRYVEVNEGLTICRSYMTHEGGAYELEFQEQLRKQGTTEKPDELRGGWAQC